MRRLVLIGMVGVLAQLIDGALGMACVLTSTTLRRRPGAGGHPDPARLRAPGAPQGRRLAGA